MKLDCVHQKPIAHTHSHTHTCTVCLWLLDVLPEKKFIDLNCSLVELRAILMQTCAPNRTKPKSKPQNTSSMCRTWFRHIIPSTEFQVNFYFRYGTGNSIRTNNLVWIFCLMLMVCLLNAIDWRTISYQIAIPNDVDGVNNRRLVHDRWLARPKITYNVFLCGCLQDGPTAIPTFSCQ